MNAVLIRKLRDLYSSNAFGDISDWRSLDGAALRAECADLHAHWASMTWKVDDFDASDMAEFLLEQWANDNADLIDEIVSVLRDGSRTDRHIQRGPKGRFGTRGKLYVTSFDTQTPSVSIPVAHDATEAQEEAWAVELYRQAERELP